MPRRLGHSATREHWLLVSIPWQGLFWRKGASSLGQLGLCAALVGSWLPGCGRLIAGLSATGVLAAAPVLSESTGMESDKAVANVARGITVRIEGATQGSGVLVQRKGDTYTVLTAWHVVSAQGPGEELAVYTPDGRDHAVMAGSIRRIGAVDLAELRFRSSTAYSVAELAPLASAPMGGIIFVSGFPHPTSAVPQLGLLRFLKGQVVADAGTEIPNGYQLLYDSKTLPGMSGGAVLNDRGQLVAIHGQGETDVKLTEQADVAVKTGTNQGVPVAFWRDAGVTEEERIRESQLRLEQESRRETASQSAVAAGAAAAPPAPIVAPAGSGQGSSGLGEALAASNPSQIALAEHLRSQGAVFYGAYWCQHCFDQKLLFGQQAGDRLPYVECARDEAGERRCVQAGVTAFPTWVLPDGERLIGVHSLQRLASWSGYRGPAAFPTSRLGFRLGR